MDATTAPKVHPDFNGATKMIVDIDKIDIPPYQRVETERWSAEIAGGWDNLLFRHPYLRPTTGGRFDCIDGQHTIRAAQTRGHEQIPVYVQNIKAAQAAATFSDVNTKRKRLRPYQVWNADLKAGREWAVDLHAVVESVGLRVAEHTSSTTVAASSQCRQLHRRGGKALLVETFGVLTEAWDTKHENRVEGLMVSGTGLLVADSQSAGTYSRAKFVSRLRKASYPGPFEGTKVTVNPESMRGYVMWLMETGKLPGMGGMVGGEGRNRVYAMTLAHAIFGLTVAREMYPSFAGR